MFAKLPVALLGLLLASASPLLAEEPPAPQAPPTAEEIQEAVQKLSKFFSWSARPSPPPAAPVRQPEWYPLKPEDASRVEETLATWDKGRAKSGGLRCQFRQWEFDPALGPQDPAIPYVYSEGEYRWDAPNIWMWRGTSARRAVARGGKTEWLDDYSQNWARNKGTFYELDYRGKTLHERHVPEDSADAFPCFGIFGIVVVPLPNYIELFRLEPAKLQDRFWIRPVTATEGKQERWLELIAKRDRDARLFYSLLVAISESDWEVCAIDLRAANYSAKTYPAHTSIEFRNRTRPMVVPGVITSVFGRSASCIPSLPQGWRRVVEDLRDAKPGPPAR